MNRISQRLGAVLLAGVYALAGVVWIFFSDQYSARMAENAYELTHYQTYKGWGFVSATTLLVYGLIRLAQFHHEALESRSRRFERIRGLLSDASHTIIQTRKMPELFQKVCDIAARYGGFQLVWIGRVNEAGTKIDIKALSPDRMPLADAVALSLTPGPENDCALTATLLEGKPFVCTDFEPTSCRNSWHQITLLQGYKSVLALPIQMFGELAGAIAFYSQEADAFDSAEVSLLETLTADLGMALAHAQSEERWILALEAAGHGVWDYNVASKKVFYSHQWKAMLGHAPHEIGDDYSDWSVRVHPNDRDLCFNQLDRLERNQASSLRVEYRLRCKDGSYKWILAQGTVFSRDSEGRALRILGTNTDITETRNRERALAEAQKVARIGSYIYDVPADNFACSDAVDDLFGIGADYPRTSESWLALVRSDWREIMRTYLADVIHNLRRFDKEYPIVRPIDGTELWLHGLGEVESDEQGAALRMVGTIQDVTDNRRNHLILKSRLELSELAQQGSTEALLQGALDRAEELTGSKIGFFHFVNSDRETLTLQTWSSNTLAHMCNASGHDTHYPISQAGVWADCIKTMAPIIHNDYATLPNRKGLPEGHAAIHRELTVPVIRQGHVVAIAGVGNKENAYTDGDAHLVQELAGFVMDLVSNIEAEKSLRLSESKLRKTTDNLQAAVDNLTQLNTELERFAFIASHDLQEPLRNITTYTQLIDRKYRDKVGPEAKEYFDLVISGAKHMYALINDLMTYSRTTSVTHPYHLISSAQACKAALDNLYSAVREAKAEIVVGDLPSVTGDEIQVMQLFQNLIANALKFRDASRAAHIEISANRINGSWQFTVKDNGIGFDPTQQDIFELFRRLHPGKGYAGTGAGLAICKRIVLRNGGRIWAESVPGEGSSFHFTLPGAEEEVV
ncbi:MAG: GAF domain-containing protein [Alphaproteobacteria bacterium]|nr:GAF domain-containing protein [Alphaproteobacteria bacterium]